MLIDVHGSLERAKDVSSFREPLFRRADAKSAFAYADADDVPLLITSRGHLLSSVRSTAWERAPRTRFGPTKTHAPPTTREGYRHPVDQGAFHRCSSGPMPVPASRSRRPHVTPMAGDNVLIGPCKHHRRDEPDV